ncbi:hypothetical protein NA57DRAFT_50805 [Rhizodiscina lignyota]|uniref:CorA-like transporter domain-containing protein n=1 Tax=Rhizodiscina lignyota TaxID=1504668 RepID=A0A9P4IMP0_9PEZI|nr:hypothetical protein NA57DRAFT_50805 [Rhizodiscina lignyota]
MGWTWEFISAYRLQKDKVNEYLVSLFGQYDFNTTILSAHISDLARGAAPQAITTVANALPPESIQLKRFQIPPQALVDDYPFEHHLDDHYEKLNKRENQLFVSAENGTSLNFLELNDADGRWKSEKVQNFARLQTILNLNPNNHTVQRDPKCRFLFLWGGHSLGRLYSTRQMLMTYFTYHQVLPNFLDFLYPFGEQQYPQDSCTNYFRAECRISENDHYTAIKEDLGRSGRNFGLCYSLKSVERSGSQPSWPWSVRHSSFYHSFDVETGATNWIIVKGNDTMKRRMTKLSETASFNDPSLHESVERLFSATFDVHLVSCDWAGENWRWYLNFLEEEFQQLTRQSYAVPVTMDVSPEIGPLPTRRSTLRAVPEVANSAWYSGRGVSPARPAQEPRGQPPPPSNPPMAPPSGPGHAVPMRTLPAHSEKQRVMDVFNFDDLQRLQFIEEKAIEALLVLESNAKVMAQMRQYYEILPNYEGWPEELKTKCDRKLQRFIFALENAENHIITQKARAETLLRILGNRRSMLYGILEYRNLEASKQATQKSQESADKMQILTEEMNQVAFKTARQTALMTLIAFVTIVYLPATFISTVMSTSIVQWNTENGRSELVYSWPALRTFLEASLPLTGITVLLCGGAFLLWIRNESGMRRRAYLQQFP